VDRPEPGTDPVRCGVKGRRLSLSCARRKLEHDSASRSKCKVKRRVDTLTIRLCESAAGHRRHRPAIRKAGGMPWTRGVAGYPRMNIVEVFSKICVALERSAFWQPRTIHVDSDAANRTSRATEHTSPARAGSRATCKAAGPTKTRTRSVQARLAQNEANATA
jgi:hypothetical protein